jgi:LysR family transcriptional regulator for metE and metH
MDTKHLKTFLSIVELSSFTRAARRLGLSQSAISQQMLAQEKALGVKLLIRGAKGVRTTPAGEILYHYAQQIVGKIEEAQKMIADYGERGSGSIRIGAGGATCEHLMPRIVREFSTKFPNSEIRVVSGHSDLTLRRLHDGDIDIGMISLPSDISGLQTFDLGSDEIVAIAPPGDVWSTLDRVPLEAFATRPLIVYERRSPVYKMFEQDVVAAGVFPRIAMELDHLGATVEMVRAEMGITVLPRWAVRGLLESGEIIARPIGKSGMFRRWALATASNGHTTSPVKAFVNLCIERMPPLLVD